MNRHTEIWVNYTDEEGVDYEEELFMGMDARIFQHELDHLNGELMLDDITQNGRFVGWERSL